MIDENSYSEFLHSLDRVSVSRSVNILDLSVRPELRSRIQELIMGVNVYSRVFTSFPYSVENKVFVFRP